MYGRASDSTITFLLTLLSVDPHLRATARASLEHTYLATFHDPDVETVARVPIGVDMIAEDYKKGTTAAYREKTYELMRARKVADSHR